MVDFIQLQDMVREQLALDRTIKTVTATGSTLEEAVAQAATLLDIPVRRLEYEVTEKGSPGIFGTGKKSWSISAYQRVAIKIEAREDEEEEEEEEEQVVIEDVNGDAFVHLLIEGAFLKVTHPQGKGKKVSDHDAIKKIRERFVTDFDEDLVKRIVHEAKGEYIKIGTFQHLPANDTMISVDIAEGEMKAFITLSPPGMGGRDMPAERIITYLQSNRITHGIDEDFVRTFADNPVYKEKVAIAEGTKPTNGRDAYIQYNFETDQSKLKLKEGINGRIDFKDLNIIQNVVENQPLGKKIPPEKGTPGRTVTGKAIPAKDGRDITLPLGKNVHAGEDEETIIADMNGQVLLAAGKVNVEPVYTVDGNVNLKTGNITFLGTVIINGNVEDGFTVKAAGNIEVNGTVEKAELDADGDIIVHQGITGKNGRMLVKAGRSLWARFIENAVIESGNMVVVSDGIINSQVDAHKRIVCQGKRAHIVGGRLRATEEINAKILGSSTSGTSTVCEVGMDPRNKVRLETLLANKDSLERRTDEIQRNLQTLINIKKQRRSLPDDKENSLKELMEERTTVFNDLKKTQEDIVKIQEILSAVKTRGKVSASSKVYPGVKITIKDASIDVNTEYRAVTYVLEDGLVKVTRYEEPDEEATKAPDGYATH